MHRSGRPPGRTARAARSAARAGTRRRRTGNALGGSPEGSAVYEAARSAVKRRGSGLRAQTRQFLLGLLHLFPGQPQLLFGRVHPRLRVFRIPVRLLFVGGAFPSCTDAVDANDDGVMDIADAIATLQYLFVQGPPPPPPGTSCGQDPTDDGLVCIGPTACAP